MCSLHNIIKYGKLFSSLDDVSCYLEVASESDAEQWGDRNYADWGTKYKRTMRIAKEIGRSTVTYPFATMSLGIGGASLMSIVKIWDISLYTSDNVSSQ